MEEMLISSLMHREMLIDVDRYFGVGIIGIHLAYFLGEACKPSSMMGSSRSMVAPALDG